MLAAIVSRTALQGVAGATIKHQPPVNELIND